MDWDASQTLTAVGIAALAGLIGGMFGVGGSVVLIPALVEVFGPNQHLYQAATMLVNLFVAIPAVYHHAQRGAIQLSAITRLIPIAAIAAAIGVGVSELSIFDGNGEAWLRLALGAFLIVISLGEVLLLMRGRGDVFDSPPNGAALEQADSSAGVMEGGNVVDPLPMRWSIVLKIAIPTGFVAGLLGLGGGLMAVPLQRRFLHIPLRHAIANSASLIVATSIVGGALKNFAFVRETGSMRSIFLAGFLIPAAMLGSGFGSRLTHRLRVGVIKVLFFLLLSLASVRLIAGAIRSLTAVSAS